MVCRQSFFTWTKWGYLLAATITYWQVERSLTQVQITPVPPQPTVGQDVLLFVKFSENIININWYREDDENNDMNILTSSEYSNTTGKQFTGRQTLRKDGSLYISNLMTSDSGIYIVQITTIYTFAVGSVMLTVSPAYGNLSPVSETTNPPINNGLTLMYSSSLSPRKKSGFLVIVGVAIFAFVGLVLFIVGLFIWLRKRNRKAPQEAIYDEPQHQDTHHMENHQLDIRPLPSTPDPPLSSVYKNITPDNEKGHYLDLSHPYRITYDELQIKNK
ncbi:uncharacterized protein O3C94_017435 isoform 2-T2 [Discoglossus pictus]